MSWSEEFADAIKQNVAISRPKFSIGQTVEGYSFADGCDGGTEDEPDAIWSYRILGSSCLFIVGVVSDMFYCEGEYVYSGLTIDGGRDWAAYEKDLWRHVETTCNWEPKESK